MIVLNLWKVVSKIDMMSVKRGMVKSVNGVTTAREIGRGISGHSAVMYSWDGGWLN